ncbi:MAG: replication factor C small subunit [Thermoplasmata archaeon]|nr:MAG: replication factor C small subunit [Thermoplasmata archaeon]
MNEIWVEKYRPAKLDDVVGQEHVVKSLKAYAKSGSIPHMLFAGPAGVGKTTCAIALAKEFYGDTWRENFEELNASDERGLEVVRGTIKNFARTAPIGNAPFKIIFLDEADALTPDAQAALRRIMEKYTSTCRFILSCNYSSRIIEPIQSRCVVFRFSPISNEDMKNYLEKIAKNEGIEITEDGIKSILYISNGDMRRAINVLQVTASVSDKIDGETVYKMTSVARPEDAKKLIEMAIKGDFINARKILDKMIIEDGLSGEDIIKGLHNAIIDAPIKEEEKAKIIDKMGETEFRIVEGSNDRIQIEALISYLVAMRKS